MGKENNIWPKEAKEAFFKILVVKKDGAPDATKANEIFDYCNKNFEWCMDSDTEESIFVLDDNSIVADFPPVNLKNASINSFDWLCEAQKKTKAERVVASADLHPGEMNSNNFYYIESIIEDGKEIKTTSSQYNGAVQCVIDSESQYLAMESNFKIFKAKLVNKKSKKEILAGTVKAFTNKGFKGDLFTAFTKNKYYYAFVDEKGNVVKLLDKKGKETTPRSGMFGFDHFADGYNIFEGFEYFKNENIKDWEFTGFETQYDYFDLYASKPNKEELEEI